MDWMDVEVKLCERAEEVCRHLLPMGKREGAEWVCGSLEGEAGQSLRVNLSGKAGLWKDFAGDKGGKTLISLWCSRRSQPFKVCIVEAKQFLGLRDDYERRVQSAGRIAGSGERGAGSRSEQTAGQSVAETWSKCAALTEGGPVWEYLVSTRRIEPAVLGAFQVREMISNGQWVMVFPYWGAGSGELGAKSQERAGVAPSWLKFEALERVEARKREWTSRGPEKCLWGMELDEGPLFREAKDVLITEGEKDALSWASWGCGSWGVHPVSVPFGAKWKGSEASRPSPNREWLDRCWDWLGGFETVYVAMDGDEAGQRAAADIITEIGPRRCRRVEMPGIKHGD